MSFPLFEYEDKKGSNGGSIKSGALFGLNYDITDDQWLNVITVHHLLDHIGAAGEGEHGGLGIDNEINLSVGMVSTHILGVDLKEGPLSVVHLNFCFSLHEVLPGLVLIDPIPVLIGDSQAEVHDVG